LERRQQFNNNNKTKDIRELLGDVYKGDQTMNPLLFSELSNILKQKRSSEKKKDRDKSPNPRDKSPNPREDEDNTNEKKERDKSPNPRDKSPNPRENGGIRLKNNNKKSFSGEDMMPQQKEMNNKLIEDFNIKFSKNHKEEDKNGMFKNSSDDMIYNTDKRRDIYSLSTDNVITKTQDDSDIHLKIERKNPNTDPQKKRPFPRPNQNRQKSNTNYKPRSNFQQRYTTLVSSTNNRDRPLPRIPPLITLRDRPLPNIPEGNLTENVGLTKSNPTTENHTNNEFEDGGI